MSCKWNRMDIEVREVKAKLKRLKMMKKKREKGRRKRNMFFFYYSC